MAHGPIPDKPEHDAESLALEEQFGLPSLSLDFGNEGRVVVRLPDNRAAARAFKGATARLASRPTRPKRSRPVDPYAQIKRAVETTPEQFDRLAKKVEDLGEDPS